MKSTPALPSNNPYGRPNTVNSRGSCVHGLDVNDLSVYRAKAIEHAANIADDRPYATPMSLASFHLHFDNHKPRAGGPGFAIFVLCETGLTGVR